MGYCNGGGWFMEGRARIKEWVVVGTEGEEEKGEWELRESIFEVHTRGEYGSGGDKGFWWCKKKKG